MGTFPLRVTPDAPWRHLANSRNAHFGAGRQNYPVHGACDLIAPAGTEILAVQDGTIIRGPYNFMESKDKSGCSVMTYAIDVNHKTFVARYAEIARHLPGKLGINSDVTEGHVIATVGVQCGGSMLHFEMFQDVNRLDYLTDRSHGTKYLYVPQANYERRSDLLDPTPYLDVWWWELKVRKGRTMDLSMEVFDPPPAPSRATRGRAAR